MPMKIFFFDTHVLNNPNSLTYLWLLRDMNTLSDTYKYDWFSYLPNGNRQIQPRAVVEARCTGTAYTKAQPSGSFAVPTALVSILRNHLTELLLLLSPGFAQRFRISFLRGDSRGVKPVLEEPKHALILRVTVP